MRQNDIDKKIVNYNVRYTNFSEIRTDRYLINLYAFIEEKKMFWNLIECVGDYTTDNKNEIWLIFGTNRDKVKDESLDNHIREAYASLNIDTDFCLDFNLYKITDSNTYLLHQAVVKKILLIELIKKCFEECKLPVPDRISLYDALAIEAIYKDTSSHALSGKVKNGEKEFSENINVIKNIINKSDYSYNPIYSAKEKKYNNKKVSSLGNNKVSPEVVIQNSEKIYSCTINSSYAKKMEEKLSLYKNILYYCSSPSLPKFAKNTISKHIPKSLNVCTFIIPESFKSEFRYLYHLIRFPNGFNYSISQLEKMGNVTFLCIPIEEYPFYENIFNSNNVPFSIGYKNSEFDIDTICIYYNSQYTFSLIELMHSFADNTRESNYSSSVSLDNTNFLHTSIKKFMEDNPHLVIK